MEERIMLNSEISKSLDVMLQFNGWSGGMAAYNHPRFERKTPQKEEEYGCFLKLVN